jgi:hypothetical protein
MENEKKNIEERLMDEMEEMKRKINSPIPEEKVEGIAMLGASLFGFLLALPFIAAEYYKQWLKFLHSQMDYYDVDKGRWVKRSLFSRIKEMFGGDKL